MAAPHGFRTERDSMGKVFVPSAALWGAQTQRAVDNFPISGQPIGRRMIRALALLKAEAAVVNARHPQVPAVDAKLGDAIRKACELVASGAHDDQYPVDVFQTGSGTSSNMNANEVIARLAGLSMGAPDKVHPNDHVNASQSSNDVFPSAIHLAATEAVITIAPRSPSAFGAFFCIAAAAALQTSSVPTRLISMTLRKNSPGIGPSLPTRRFGQPTPAQFTARLRPPIVAVALATAASTAASDVTSVATKEAW